MSHALTSIWFGLECQVPRDAYTEHSNSGPFLHFILHHCSLLVLLSFLISTHHYIWLHYLLTPHLSLSFICLVHCSIQIQAEYLTYWLHSLSICSVHELLKSLSSSYYVLDAVDLFLASGWKIILLTDTWYWEREDWSLSGFRWIGFEIPWTSRQRWKRATVALVWNWGLWEIGRHA